MVTDLRIGLPVQLQTRRYTVDKIREAKLETLQQELKSRVGSLEGALMS